MSDDLNEVITKLEIKLNSRSLRTLYRHAVKVERPFAEKVIERISSALEWNCLQWLLLNGYKPEESDAFLKLISQEFDFGNQFGVAVSMIGLKEDETLPLNARIILMLIERVRQLRQERDDWQRRFNYLRPSWLVRLINWWDNNNQ